MKPPVIIFGMHRSGTTLILKLLRELGLYAGEKINKNHEAPFFRDINEMLLRKSGGSWSFPNSINYLIKNEKLSADVNNELYKYINSWKIIEFIGLRNYLKDKGNSVFNSTWGWKDPRNTYTLDFWTNIYQKPKIIYIKRNGVDVANSLCERENKFLSESQSNLFINKKISSIISQKIYNKEVYSNRSPRCLELKSAFELWEEYTQKGQQEFDNYSNDKIELRYEDFLEKPHEILSSLVNFCNLNTDIKKIDEAVSKIKVNNKYKFLNDKLLSDFYMDVRMSDQMLKLGYSKIFK